MYVAIQKEKGGMEEQAGGLRSQACSEDITQSSSPTQPQGSLGNAIWLIFQEEKTWATALPVQMSPPL